MRLLRAMLLIFFVATSQATPAEFLPRYLNSPAPNYPDSAYREGIEGTVLLKVLVSEFGTVDEISIFVSSRNVDLDNAALEATKKSRFIPSKNEAGRSVPRYVIIPIKFTLDQKTQPTNPMSAEEAHNLYVELTLPTLSCADVIKEARAFSKENPKQEFTNMNLFQATNDHMKKYERTPTKVSAETFNNALLKCIDRPALMYLEAIEQSAKNGRQ